MDAFGEMKKDIPKDASDSNWFMAGVKGLGTGLVGALELGTKTVNFGAGLITEAVADENSSR